MKQIYSKRMILNKIGQYNVVAIMADRLIEFLKIMKNTENEFEFAVLQEQAQEVEKDLLVFVRRLVQMYSDEPYVLQKEMENETF